MSQNGPYDGMGNAGNQPQQPTGPGDQGGAQWPGQASGYPPAGSSYPSAGTPQPPAGWGQQGQPTQNQPSGQGWQGQPPVYPSAGTPQGPAPDWGQQPSGQGWQGQPGQQQPSDQGWQGQPGQFGAAPAYGDQQGYGAQQGFDQQAYGGQPPGGYPGGPQQPWGYPPDGGQNQPRRTNKAVLGVVGGVVGLALVGGTVWAVNNNRTSADPTPQVSVSVSQGQPSPGGGSSVPPSVATVKASDAVTAYLQALAIGDANAALSLAAVAPAGDTTFLENKVLAKSTRGKLTDIQVTDVTDPNATSVDASYKLNGKQVSTTFGVTKVGDQFRLNQVTATVDISQLATKNVPVSLAGVKASRTMLNLFPGVYPVTAANKYFSYGSAKINVTNLDEVAARAGKVSISSSGKSATIKAAKKKFSWCLKQHSVRPSGCGFAVRVPSGVKLRTNTIKWTTRSAINWGKVSPKLLGSTLVEAKAKGKVHFYARDARVSGRYWYKDLPVTGFNAKVSGSKITVAFY